MTELALHRPPAPTVEWAAPSGLPPAVASLVEWAQSATAAYEVAQRLVVTSFVPAQFRDKPEEAAAAILAGGEVGLQPMAALRSFDIIQGVAAPRAMTQRAIVQARGHTIRVVESTSTRAIVEGWRLGQGKESAQRSTWTADRARDLALLGKDNWRKQPAAMLIARATSECCRLVASDALLGIPYSAEELADTETGAVETAAPARRTAQRAKLTSVEPPPLDDVDEGTVHPGGDAVSISGEAGSIPADAPVPSSALATKAQLTKLHTLMSELGMTEREAGLAFLSSQVDRELESSKELTKAEASRIIDELEPVWPPVAEPPLPEATS